MSVCGARVESTFSSSSDEEGWTKVAGVVALGEGKDSSHPESSTEPDAFLESESY